jgi:hypothetical protein
MSQKEEEFFVAGSKRLINGNLATVEVLREGRELPRGEVGCKICNKSIHQIFVEHLEEHLK